MRIRFLLAAAAVLALPLTTKAESYTYNYTGSTFNTSDIYTPGTGTTVVNPVGSVAAPYSTADSVSGWFTIDGPVDGLNDGPFEISAVSFSFSDGVQTLSSAAGDSLDIWQFSTGTGGDVTGYSITAVNPSNASDFISIGSGGSPAAQGNFAVSASETVSALTNTFGSFSGPIAATPEPSSLALLGSGVLGIAFELRRRVRRA